MKFESSLSCEQIKQRLLSKTTSSMFFAHKDDIMSKWRKNNTFYISKRNFIFLTFHTTLAFVGKVTQQGNINIISGKFIFSNSTKRFMLFNIGFCWITVLIAFFHNRNDVDMYSVALLAIGTVLSYVILEYLPPPFNRENKEAIIDFINQNLLK